MKKKCVNEVQKTWGLIPKIMVHCKYPFLYTGFYMIGTSVMKELIASIMKGLFFAQFQIMLNNNPIQRRTHNLVNHLRWNKFPRKFHLRCLTGFCKYPFLYTGFYMIGTSVMKELIASIMKGLFFAQFQIMLNNNPIQRRTHNLVNHLRWNKFPRKFHLRCLTGF